jgi:hypothetical protein
MPTDSEFSKLLYEHLRGLSETIDRLSGEVKADTIALAELRVEFANLGENVYELSKLVRIRTSNDESLVSRVKELSICVDKLEEEFDLRKKNKIQARVLIWGIVLGAIMGGLMDLLINHLGTVVDFLIR